MLHLCCAALLHVLQVGDIVLRISSLHDYSVLRGESKSSLCRYLRLIMVELLGGFVSVCVTGMKE